MNIDPGILKSLLVLCSVIEARDFFTGGHVWRVAEYSKLTAEKLGLPKSEIVKAYLGGYLHDIGKIGIPDFILNKQGKLTDEEFNIIKFHPRIGTQIIKDHPLEDLVFEAISYHHERLDGSGYPYGIEEKQINMIPRIVSIADSFDAITSVRPYKNIISGTDAMDMLVNEKSSGLDSSVLLVFKSLVENGDFDAVTGHSDFSRPLLECPACGPMLAVNNHKKNGDTVECHACRGVFKIHLKKSFFELEILRDEKISYQPEVDHVQIDRMVDNSIELSN